MFSLVIGFPWKLNSAHFPRVSNHLAEREINCFKIYMPKKTDCFWWNLHQDLPGWLLYWEGITFSPKHVNSNPIANVLNFWALTALPNPWIWKKIILLCEQARCAGWSSDTAINTCERTGFLVLRNFICLWHKWERLPGVFLVFQWEEPSVVEHILILVSSF